MPPISRARLQHPVEDARPVRDVLRQVGLEDDVHRARDVHLRRPSAARCPAATLLRPPSAPIRYLARIGVLVAAQPVADRRGDAVVVLSSERYSVSKRNSRAAAGGRADQDRLEAASAAGRRQRRAGLRCSRRAARGCVPQVRIRPISSPARLVQKAVWPISSCGGGLVRVIWSSMPMSRSSSIVRWLVMWARGVLAVQPVAGQHDVVDAVAWTGTARRPHRPGRCRRSGHRSRHRSCARVSSRGGEHQVVLDSVQ